MSCQPNTSIPQNPPSGGSNHFLAKMLVRGTHLRPVRRWNQPDTECPLTEHSSLPSRDHVSARLDLRFGRPTVRWSRRRSHHEADCWRRCGGGGLHLWTAMLSRPASDDNQSCPPRANVARVLEGIQRHARDHVWNAADLRRTVHSLPMVLGQSQTTAVLLRVPDCDLDHRVDRRDGGALLDRVELDLRGSLLAGPVREITHTRMKIANSKLMHALLFPLLMRLQSFHASFSVREMPCHN